MDQLPRLGKRELICLLLFTCNYVVSVWRGFLFLLVLGMGYVILLWHSLSLHIIILKFRRCGLYFPCNENIVAAKLICAFVFAFVKTLFSLDAAHITQLI